MVWNGVGVVTVTEPPIAAVAIVPATVSVSPELDESNDETIVKLLIVALSEPIDRLSGPPVSVSVITVPAVLWSMSKSPLETNVGSPTWTNVRLWVTWPVTSPAAGDMLFVSESWPLIVSPPEKQFMKVTVVIVGCESVVSDPVVPSGPMSQGTGVSSGTTPLAIGACAARLPSWRRSSKIKGRFLGSAFGAVDKGTSPMPAELLAPTDTKLRDMLSTSSLTG